MIQVTWDDDSKAIIMVKFSQGWSVDHMVKALNEVYALAETVDHDIYMIFNLLEASTLPNASLANLRSVSTKVHPRIKKIIDVTTSRFINTLTQVFKSVYREGSIIEVVQTLDEAYDVIRQDQRKSNSDSPGKNQ